MAGAIGIRPVHNEQSYAPRGDGRCCRGEDLARRRAVERLACAPNDPGDRATAILRLTLDRVKTRQLSAGARRTAEVLDWSVELDALDRSYREIAFRFQPFAPRLDSGNDDQGNGPDNSRR